MKGLKEFSEEIDKLREQVKIKKFGNKDIRIAKEKILKHLLSPFCLHLDYCEIAAI